MTRDLRFDNLCGSLLQSQSELRFTSVDGIKPVSYTHLTLPTNREV